MRTMTCTTVVLALLAWCAPLSAANRVDYSRLPLQFEQNAGQANPNVKFLARMGSRLLTIEPGQVTFHGTNTSLRMVLPGANQQAGIEGQAMLPGKSNYV